MENTSTTILTDRCLLDERAAIDNLRTESLVAHELAHQWFGDLVVIKHWSHAWIKEGMASYAEVLWTEQEYGKDDAAYYLLNEARSYLDEDSSRYRRPIVTHVYREAIELYDRHLYEKGACVYHMIRGILGEELFDRAIQTFVRDNAHKTVETVDLLRAIEQSTGYNLLFLFDQYVFRGGHPDFKISYSWDGDSNLAKLTVTQTQARTIDNGKIEDLFDLKIPVAFNYLNALPTTLTLHLKEKEQSFYLPLSQKPDFISFDVDNYTLKTVELDYPIAELKTQLTHDLDPISRIYAAIAIGKKGGLDAIKILRERLKTEPFWGVRVEIAEQLGKIKLDQSVEALKAGLADSDAKVRRAVVSALTSLKTLPSLELIKHTMLKGDASYTVEATAATSLGSMVNGHLQTQTDEIIATLKQILETRSGWNEVVRSGAIAGLGKLTTSPTAVDIILDYTQLGIPQPLRLSAVRALGAVSTGQTPDKLQVILDRLEVIAQESFFLTQVAVAAALGQMETSKAIAILQSLADSTPDGRVRRMAEEAMGKVRAKLGSEQELKTLREELDKLKQENQEIKSQIAELKAK